MNGKKIIMFLLKHKQVSGKTWAPWIISIWSNGLITHVLNQNKKLYCAFVDFTKVFDFVNRDILWYKLIKKGLEARC